MSAESARRNVRILTWIGFATGVIGGLLIAFPTVIGLASPWVQVALGVATLVMAFRARKIGMAEVEGSTADFHWPPPSSDSSSCSSPVRPPSSS